MLALIASFALTAVYMLVSGGGAGSPKPAAPLADAGVEASAVVQPAAAAAPVVPGAPAPAPAAGELPSRTLQVDRAEVHFQLSTDGAALTSAQLQGPKMREVSRLSIPEGFELLFGKGGPSLRCRFRRA
jgi:YidC/Oxa1 family membrane protein insertase